MAALSQTWIDRTLSTWAPRWHLHRTRARVAADYLLRHYEGAAFGRRTQGWNIKSTDANAAQSGQTLARLRDVARDLVRNNAHAEAAVSTIGDHTVGWGIVAKPQPARARVAAAWKAWAESTECDADGRDDFYGLQKLVMHAVVESGEVLIRRRWRRLADGYALPLQLQILEPDLLDASQTRPLLNGGRIVQGVEFDALGARVAYWLFPSHPGSAILSTLTSGSRRVDARDVLHVFRRRRPGQVRGASWFAPVVLRLKDFDEYEDATLMKQKIAACLSIITSDPDGTGPALGTADDTVTPGLDALGPGAIVQIPPGRDIDVVQPPAVTDHASYCGVTLRAIATGLGIAYEDLTGDYATLSFSAARMSRIRHWARVDDWRWRLLIPQFCDPVWQWAMEAAEFASLPTAPEVRWSPPPMPMIEPDKEGLAIQRNVRTGIQTLSEAIRERGHDPDEFFMEMASDNAKLDALGLVLDSDPRQMTQAGQAQSSSAPAVSVGASE